MPASNFGDLLRRYRVAVGLTQEDLAERAGLSTRGISDLERGARGLPRKDTLQMLLDALKLSPAEQAALVAAARRSPTPAGRRDRADGLAALPVAPTPLIGRERELATLQEVLLQAAIRLLTLTGPGGIGKTQLSLQLATDLRDCFADGVLVVPLAPLTDPDHVAPAIAQVLGVQEAPGRSLLASLQDTLRDTERLLLLDNFEPVVRAAPLVAELLAACPALKVLVTSREPLHVRGERQFAVPPLALPDARRLPELATLSQVAAVRLFVARAQEVQAEFTLTTENAPAVAEICLRLDGLPLALELAAARSKILSPAALLARLDRRLPLLTGGARDLPERQQTLRDTIAWSYDLLSEEEQGLFRHLAVFAGGWTADAAEVVANPSGALDVLEGISSLVDKSLVRQGDQPDDEPRFTMLETIREYALEQLTASPEAEEARRCHAAYYLALAETLRPRIEGPQGPTVLNQFEIEHPNTQAALAWAVARGDVEIGLHLIAAIWKFWWVHNHLTVGREWTEQILTLPGDLSPALWIEARYAAGSFARGQSDLEAAWQHGEQGLALARQIAEPYFLPSMLYLLGNIARDRHDEDQAIARYEEALGFIQRRTTDHPLASHQEAMILSSCGAAHAARGAYGHAASFIEAARAIWQERHDRWGLGLAAHDLGMIHAAQGRTDQAAAYYRESLGHHREVGDTAAVGEAIARLASLRAAQGQWSEAARLFGAAEAIGEMTGVPGTAMILGDHEETVTAVRRALSDEEFTTEWLSGRGLTIEEVATEVQAVARADSRSPD